MHLNFLNTLNKTTTFYEAKRRVCPTFYTWRFVPGYAVHYTDRDA